MKRLLLATLVVAAAIPLTGSASAYCDPDYKPLCANDCVTRLPDPADPVGWLTRACPR